MKLSCHTIGPVQANCYIITAENSRETAEAVVIDPGQGIEPVLQAVEGLEVAMILLSHGHFDHIAGAAALKEATDAPVFIHQAEEQWPTNPNLNGSANLGEMCPVPVTGPRPDELLEDGQRLNWAGPELTCLHTPGHTPGGVSFYAAEEAAVFTGDALFAGSIGRTDLPGGDHEQLLAALRDKLLSLADDTVVYPGHGPTTTIGEQAAHNPFLMNRQP